MLQLIIEQSFDICNSCNCCYRFETCYMNLNLGIDFSPHIYYTIGVAESRGEYEAHKNG